MTSGFSLNDSFKIIFLLPGAIMLVGNGNWDGKSPAPHEESKTDLKKYCRGLLLESVFHTQIVSFLNTVL